MVTLEHVSKDYYRGSIVIQALRDISVYIGEGEFCSLMGPSGSGKSTFLNVIAGLDTVTSGDVLLNGESTRGFSDEEWTKWRREWIGMVFQAFHLVPSLTAAENVGLPLLLNRMSAKLACERVNETLEMVGIEGRANHRPSELSGGEQTRDFVYVEDVADAVIGIVGLGSIGSEIARRARAFGMRVLAVDPDPRPDCIGRYPGSPNPRNSRRGRAGNR